MSRTVTVVAAATLLLASCGCRGRRSPYVRQPAQQPITQQAPPEQAPPPEHAMRAADAGDLWTFQGGGVEGTLPAGFRTVKGQWGIATEAETRGLLQAAKNTNPDFNLVMIDTKSYADVQISVRVHALGGEIDQGGGPVWRARDGQNYYIARWNPLEDNYRVYKVVDGVRMELGSAETKPGSNSRLLDIRMTGSEIECSLDGEALLLVKDETFPAAGKIGLWAKADARTLFSRLVAAGL